MSSHTAEQHFEHLRSIIDPGNCLPAVELRPWVEEERLHAFRIHPFYPDAPDIGAVALFDALSTPETAIDIEVTHPEFIGRGFTPAAFITALSIAHSRGLTATNHPDFYLTEDGLRLWELLECNKIAEFVQSFKPVEVWYADGRLRGSVRCAPLL